MLLVLDINETMLDISPIDAVLAELVGQQGLEVEWFELMIRTALVCAASGQYRDFGELGAAAAAQLAERHGARQPDDAAGKLGAAMRQLMPHPDVQPALVELRGQGHRIVALGNSPAKTVNAQLHHAGLAALIDVAYSAEQAGALKPARGAYQYVLDHEHTTADQAILVAAHDWDIAGAQAAGMRTAFVSRTPGATPLRALPTPDFTVTDLSALIPVGLGG